MKAQTSIQLAGPLLGIAISAALGGLFFGVNGAVVAPVVMVACAVLGWLARIASVLADIRDRLPPGVEQR